MTNNNATTPQLKALKELGDALASGNIKNAEPLLSKDYTFRTFPKVAELPDLPKEEYLQKMGAVFGAFAKVELIFHEVIEAPGKVVTHHSFSFTTVDGTVLSYDAVGIAAFVHEDGALKFLDIKDFTDPTQRGAFYAEAVKTLDKGTFAA